MVSKDGGVYTIRPEVITPIIPPLKTLVAEYLFDCRGNPAFDHVSLEAHYEVLRAFLDWEEKRRTPPKITTRPGGPNTSPLIQQGGISINDPTQKVQWVTSGRQDP